MINHNDSINGFDLKVDQWMLLNAEPDITKIRTRGVTTKLRAEVLERDLSTCQTCGRTIGDEDPFKPGHKITLHIGHLKAHKGEDGSISNVGVELTKDHYITQCNVCNEGNKNKDVVPVTLISRVYKATPKEQRELFEYLTKKFNNKEEGE